MLVGACCTLEARLLCRAANYAHIPFFAGHQLLKVFCGFGPGLVVLCPVLPVNSVSLVENPAVDHLLGVKLQLAFVGDGDACCLELLLLLVESFGKLGDVYCLFLRLVKCGGHFLDRLGVHLAPGTIEMLEMISDCDVLVAH